MFGKIVLATAHTKDGQGGGHGRVVAEMTPRTPRCSPGEMTDNQKGVGQRACVKCMGLGYMLKRDGLWGQMSCPERKNRKRNLKMSVGFRLRG